MAGVGWCIERRCALLGLDSPKKVAPTDPSGEKEWGEHWGQSATELEEKYRALAKKPEEAGRA